MKLTIKQVADVSAVLGLLKNRNLPKNLALKFHRLNRQLATDTDFYLVEFTKLVEKYEATWREDGVVIIKDKEKAKEFAKEADELNALECDTEYERVTIPADVNFEISFEAIDTLSALFDFEEVAEMH